MKFGIFYVLETPTENHARDYAEMLEQIEYAEELGFDSVWLAEHHSSQYGSIPDLAVAAAAIAQRTKTMRIGLAVTILPFRDPVRVAEQYAMVDVLSEGRLNFGVGRGYQPSEFKNMRKDPAISREVFQESLEIILGLWTNERFSYQGKHFQLDDVKIMPKPVQKPHPPVWVAAISPQTFQLVAEKDFQVLTTPTLMVLPELKDAIIGSARTLISHGRPPENIDFPFLTQVHVAPTLDQAKANTQQPLDWYFDKVLSLVPGAKGGKVAPGYERYAEVVAAMSGGITFEMLSDFGIVTVSDPEGVKARLRELRNDIGVKEFLSWMRFGGLEHEKVMASMRLFAEEVMPEFIKDETPVPEGFVAETPPKFFDVPAQV